MNDLTHHQADPKLKARAKNAGIDLDDLKKTDPEQYKMLTSQPLLYITQDLLEWVEPLFTSFPQHSLYQMPAGALTQLRVFPDLTPDELELFDSLLANVTERPALAERFVFYRVVSDTAGERRELMLPVAPSAWQQEVGVMVGPFDTQEDADNWAHERMSAGVVFDSLLYRNRWFCDVFKGSYS